ncbi:MAG TPA: phage baseplate assembly protein V [Blastocatellia bacterium]|jgi:hypothetical protein
MDYRHNNHGPSGVIQRTLNSAQNNSLDGRFLGMLVGRVTNIEDPDKQNRVKATLQFQQEDGIAEMETGWLWQMTNFAGPTNINRGRVFGVDWPMPEVGSLIYIWFNGGNPHDGHYGFQPRYGEGGTAAPSLAKDDKRDWCFRLAFQNGTEFGIDTEGNVYLHCEGNLRVKVQGQTHISSRGTMTLIASKLRALSMSVLRLLGVTIDQTNYPRPDEAAQVREMMIDAMRGVPGRKDPKIGKIGYLE